MSFLSQAGSIVIYDTEFTSWEGFREKNFRDVGRYPEIIQFGAVKLDAGNGLAEIDTYRAFVRPKVNPRLSDYIIDLTGIRQEDVDERGVEFSVALGRLEAFVSGPEVQLFSFGRDGRVVQINRDLNGLDDSGALSGEQNLKEILISKGLVSSEVTSSTLASHIGLSVDFVHHDALEDARSVAAVLRHLRTRGQI